MCAPEEKEIKVKCAFIWDNKLGIVLILLLQINEHGNQTTEV